MSLTASAERIESKIEEINANLIRTNAKLDAVVTELEKLTKALNSILGTS